MDNVPPPAASPQLAQHPPQLIQYPPVPPPSAPVTRMNEGAYHHHHHHGGHACVADKHHHQSPPPPVHQEIDPEKLHLKEVLVTFLEYSKYMGKQIERRWRHLCNLQPKHASTLPPSSLGPKLHQERLAVNTNQEFLEMLVQCVGDISASPDVLNLAFADLQRNENNTRVLTSPANISKIKATLHSCVREWSTEGSSEREACFIAITNELQHYLPVTSQNRYKQRVLVPGAGLGRLPLEIAARGYACQGNEFSWFMLLTSNFLLNYMETVEAFTIFPFIEQTCNLVKTGDNTRRILIPDVSPADLLSQQGHHQVGGATTAAPEGEEEYEDEAVVAIAPDFSMVAGDFQEVYAKQVGCWDCVVTCFFLDTAPVVIECIELIHQLLRPGGIWINFGPLLYHFFGEGSDERYHRSVELTWEEIKYVMVEGYGFEIKREESRASTYAANPVSMMKTVYDCIFFTAVKPADDKRGEEGAVEADMMEGKGVENKGVTSSK